MRLMQQKKLVIIAERKNLKGIEKLIKLRNRITDEG
jgi:hypothetical protein